MTQDDVEAAVKKALDAFGAFEEEPSMATAAAAEWKLSLLKLAIQPSMFNQLPAFERALKRVADFIQKHEEEEVKRNEQDCLG